MSRTTAALCAATLAALVASPGFAATELVTNGGFETGDFTGWSVGHTAGNNVCCMGFGGTGSKVQTGGSNLPTALNGSFSAYGDWDGGDGSAPIDLNLATDFWIRQAITKTTDVTSATLSFRYAVAGGAYENYNANPGYGGVKKRDVTANFLGSDLSLKANLFDWERALMTGNESFQTQVFDVSIDVTQAFNDLDNGAFFLDFGRHIPQYFTGAGYFVMDNASLVVGEAVQTGGGVPEPQAWALMILGFAGAGAALRGGRRVASA